MVSPSDAEYFIANQDAFSYILWEANDSFEYEVYAIGSTIEAVFKPLLICDAMNDNTPRTCLL